MYDENPRADAKQYNTHNMDVKAMLFDPNEFCWVCPVCNTDGYLIDL